MPVVPGAHRAAFTLDPDWTFLNHGSFGATPRAVQAERRRWLDRMEAQPVRFLARELPGLIAAARAELAPFFGTDAAGLAFVPNATTGIAAVLASAGLGPGDRILTTDHRYQAVHEALAATVGAAGVEALPLARVGHRDPAAVVAALRQRLATGPRPALLVVSWITSPTAIVLPVAALVAEARAAGVPVLVDGAHAPGQVDIALDTLGADYFVGNLHKWLCAPKGCALLWVAPAHRDRVHAPAVSHGRGQGLHAEFDWPGTFDPSPWLAAPAALRQHEAWGGAALRAAHRALAQDGLAQLLSAGVRAEAVVVPGSPMAGAMATVRLPLPAAAAPRLMAALHAHRIEVPVLGWWSDCFLRISAFAAHNRPEDVARLCAVLPAAVAAVRRG